MRHIRRGIFVLAAVVFLVFPRTATAGQQAERAIKKVRQLVASGQIKKDAVIRITVKEGNINNFWGQDFQLKDEWEQRTGTMIDASIFPQIPVLAFLKKHPGTDITLARQNEYPDLVSGDYICDLAPYFKKYGFSPGGKPGSGLPDYYLPGMQMRFAGKVIAVPSDGDIAILYLRKDLLEDRSNGIKFKQKYGRDLVPPRTWDEYQDLVEFFHQPVKGFYGSCEERSPGSGWMFWMPRYVCRANPNRFLFDHNMRPLIDSPEGVAATRSYLKTVKFSPPGILDKGNNYSYTMPIFSSGHAFSLIITMAGAKVFNLDTSPVKGKFMCAHMPGVIVKNRLIRRTMFIYGNNIVIPSTSKNKDLAFLYAMWLSDRDISVRSVNVASGMSDPYRLSHFRNKDVRATYTPSCIDYLDKIREITLPSGIGVPGNNEYLQALNKNLWLASGNKISAREAMKRTAAQWEKITDKYGRKKQAYYWNNFKKKFPATSFEVPPDLKKRNNQNLKKEQRSK